MGAMQAQDFSMSKLAIGLRLKDATEKDIEDAFNRGEIFRTHLMRPTWHFVTAEDIYWMLELTAPQIKSSLKTRHTSLELTAFEINKSFRLIETTLFNKNSITREELTKKFTGMNIRTDDNRLSHILLLAELEGLICNGMVKGNKTTYSLLPERVPVRKRLSREESLAELAKRYFVSHGPATIRDFAWWSGLSLKDSHKAFEAIRKDFLEETIDSDKYWMKNKRPGLKNNSPVFLLPAYDEFLISYQNRSAALKGGMDKTSIISQNGIFRPIIVINGKVCGLWRKLSEKNRILIEVNLPIHFYENRESLFEEKTNQLSQFYNTDVKLIFR